MRQDAGCHKPDIYPASSCPKVVVALGANLESRVGAPANTLSAALDALGDSHLTVHDVSRFYATPCFPAGAGPDYVNAAAVLSGSNDPADVLVVLHRIEADFGRARDRRWGGRTLDLDLIALGDSIRPNAATYHHWRNLTLSEQMTLIPNEIILPHPRLQDRAFVLIPLCDVAPDWRHPILGLTVRQMVDALPKADKSAVLPL